VKAGLTTWQGQETITGSQLAQLSVLLNSLENVVENLNYKSFEAYATLALATQNLRAALFDTATDEGGTEYESV
jgi:hypothetical protein